VYHRQCLVQKDVPGKLALGLDSHNSLETVILKRLKHEEYIHFPSSGQLRQNKNRSKTELSPAKKFMKFGLLLGVDAVGDCSSMKVCAV